MSDKHMCLDPKTKVDKCIVKFLSKAPYPFNKNGYDTNTINNILNDLIEYVQHYNPNISDDDIFNEMFDIDCNHKQYLEISLTVGPNRYNINFINATNWVSLNGRKFLYDVSHEESHNSQITTNYNYNGSDQIINNNSRIGIQNNHSNVDINKINNSSFNKGIKELLSCGNKMSDANKKQLHRLINQLKDMYYDKLNKHGMLRKFKGFIKKMYHSIKGGLSLALAAIELKNQIM